MFRFSLQLLSETFVILQIILRDIVIMYVDLHVKYLLFLLELNQT
jgi:hypothetical protein